MTLEEYLEIQPFIKHFCMHFDLLMRRYERFKEINDPHNTDIDVITYLDMIIVQLRAMCIESSNLKNNYTVRDLIVSKKNYIILFLIILYLVYY